MSHSKSYARRAEALDQITAALSRMPVKVWGNWCGPNFGAGKPTDELDTLCMQHDLEYSGNKVLADQKFIKRLKKMKNPTVLSRAIGSIFEHVVMPMRQIGLLDQGSEKALVPYNTTMTAKSYQNYASPNVQPRQPGSYISFQEEYGIPVAAGAQSANSWLWKNGSLGTDFVTPPVSPGGSMTMFSSGNRVGDCADTTTATRWTFQPATNRVYRATIKLSNTSVSANARFTIGFSTLTTSMAHISCNELPWNLVSGIVTARYSSFTMPIGSSTAEYSFYFSVAAPYTGPQIYVAPYLAWGPDVPTYRKAAGDNTTVSFQLEGIGPVGSAMTF